MPTDQLAKLEEAARGGVTPMLLADRVAKATVAEWVAQGNAAQLVDPAWPKELLEWLCFNDGEAHADPLIWRVSGVGTHQAGKSLVAGHHFARERAASAPVAPPPMRAAIACSASSAHLLPLTLSSTQ